MKVIGYEYRSNNSSYHTVAKLECGHERTFQYGYYPTGAVCWQGCDRKVTADILVHAIRWIRRLHMSRAWTLDAGDEKAVAVMENLAYRLQEEI